MIHLKFSIAQKTIHCKIRSILFYCPSTHRLYFITSLSLKLQISIWNLIDMARFKYRCQIVNWLRWHVCLRFLITSHPFNLRFHCHFDVNLVTSLIILLLVKVVIFLSLVFAIISITFLFGVLHVWLWNGTLVLIQIVKFRLVYAWYLRDEYIGLLITSFWWFIIKFKWNVCLLIFLHQNW